MNKELPCGIEENSSIPGRFIEVLNSAVSIRTRTIPQIHFASSLPAIENATRVAILFSGGLDCSVLAWLVHLHLALDEPIDLINVAFENPRTVAAHKTKPEDVYSVCPDRVTGLAGWKELKTRSLGARRWRFLEVAPREISLIID
jgi:asparagine synthetase B (glutamine-hydrolysing)